MNASTVACVVVAAGRGERLGADGPKAFVEVGNRTPLEHVAQTAARDTAVNHLVVVVPGDLVGAARRLLDDAGVAASVVAGGETRQESVAAGLAALDDSDEIVLVHDAARCLMPGEVYDRVIAAVQAGHSAVVPVLPVVDTIKRVEDGAVTGTVDRSELRVVQTPQGFRRGVLFAAHEAAIRRGDAAASDDAGLVERLGIPVHVVDGDDRGLKITHPFDLALVGALVRTIALPGEASS